jgi:glyoxylase I family protein
MSNQEAPHPKTIFTFTTTHAVVRYQVSDLDSAVAFYTGPLGFRLEQQIGPIAIVARGDLHLLLSGPKSSGARTMPDGRKQEPGGWNRLVLYVDDLARRIEELRTAGVVFRNSVETGPGGSQILIEDPDGNPLELHESPT